MIQQIMEAGARMRESSALGGIVTFPDGTELPCSVGVEAGGIQRADNSAGFNVQQARRIIVRSSLLAGLADAPRSGDTLLVQGRLETEPVALVIQPGTGIEAMNGILTAFNLYNPNP